MKAVEALYIQLVEELAYIRGKIDHHYQKQNSTDAAVSCERHLAHIRFVLTMMERIATGTPPTGEVPKTAWDHINSDS